MSDDGDSTAARLAYLARRRLKAALPEESAYLAFVAAALFLALSSGLVLAVLLPIDAARGFSLGARWVALAQVHGHLQSVGFLGLVVVGIGLRLSSRFSGRRLAFPTLVPLTLALLVGALVLRAVGQAFADQRGFPWVMALGGWAEFLGALAFAANLTATLRHALRAQQQFAWFFSAGSLWFAAQALLAALWLTDAARHDQSVLPFDRDSVLLLLQLFGFPLLFLLGVTLRVFPVFFAAAMPSPRASAVVWAATQVGIALLLAAGLRATTSDARWWVAQDVGFVVLGFGFVAATMLTGWWHTPSRLRPMVQPLGRMLQAAMAWLIVAAGLTIFFALRAGTESRAMPPAELDSVRHIVALGVLLMAIIGMAHLVLPEFATERLARRSARRRAWGFGLALSIAAITRAAPGIADSGLPSRSDYWHMAAAGIIAFAAILCFAWLLWRAYRQQPILLRQLAAAVDADQSP